LGLLSQDLSCISKTVRGCQDEKPVILSLTLALLKHFLPRRSTALIFIHKKKKPDKIQAPCKSNILTV